MKKNYIEKFMKDNGLSIDEKFNIYPELGTYYINSNYILYHVDLNRGNRPYHNLLVKLLNGNYKVKPIFPQLNKRYYYVTFGSGNDHRFKSFITSKLWEDVPLDKANLDYLNCFKTFKEAQDKFILYSQSFNKIKFKLWSEANGKQES